MKYLWWRGTGGGKGRRLTAPGEDESFQCPQARCAYAPDVEKLPHGAEAPAPRPLRDNRPGQPVTYAGQQDELLDSGRIDVDGNSRHRRRTGKRTHPGGRGRAEEPDGRTARQIGTERRCYGHERRQEQERKAALAITLERDLPFPLMGHGIVLGGGLSWGGPPLLLFFFLSL